MAVSQLGSYELLEELAVGGMARLYKARRVGAHGFEKLVVIKKILPNLAKDEQFVHMFIDEARITAQLDHPKIVQVFELGTEANELFIAMQYVDGIDVLNLLRGSEPNQYRLPPLAAWIARETLDALDYAHGAAAADGKSLGIIHRDISPGNVLLSRRGDVRLTDFGIAMAVHRGHRTDAGTLKGKYSYMSPEQVAGFEIDARSDLFSVGTLLIEMLMGRRLFWANNDLDILLMVRDARLERLDKHGPHIPPALRAVAGKGLQRDPRDRYETAGAFRDAIDDWLYTSGHRVGPREVADHVAEVLGRIEAQTDGVVSVAHDHFATLSGPSTRISQEEADQAMAAGRAEYRAGTGEHTPAPEPIEDEESRGIEVEEPTEQGDFRTVSPIRLLFRLSVERKTGLLIAEGRAGRLKEIYLKDGQPNYVASNVLSERLGEYMIAQGAITTEELDGALPVMHHFGGRLADTLVGLGLLEPLEGFRLLARQVRDKIVDLCAWKKGKYRWYPDKKNPWATRPVHLDLLRVIGAGATALDAKFAQTWLEDHATERLVKVTEGISLDRFGLGEAPARVHGMLDGTRTMGEIASQFRSTSAQMNFARLMFLLVQCGRAR
jgi:hypothetical protein